MKKPAKKPAKTTRKSHLSAAKIHKIYSAAASKAWVTIYQKKISKTKNPAKLKVFRARLAELKRAA